MEGQVGNGPVHPMPHKGGRELGIQPRWHSVDPADQNRHILLLLHFLFLSHKSWAHELQQICHCPSKRRLTCLKRSTPLTACVTFYIHHLLRFRPAPPSLHLLQVQVWTSNILARRTTLGPNMVKQTSTSHRDRSWSCNSAVSKILSASSNLKHTANRELVSRSCRPGV